MDLRNIEWRRPEMTPGPGAAATERFLAGILAGLFFFLILVSLPLIAYSESQQAPECSFDIRDWTALAQDLALSKTRVDDLAGPGFTRIELSVPWTILEPEPGRFDLQWLEQRIALCEQAGTGMRLRINNEPTPETRHG